jgi:hypothetical protein
MLPAVNSFLGTKKCPTAVEIPETVWYNRKKLREGDL